MSDLIRDPQATTSVLRGSRKYVKQLFCCCCCFLFGGCCCCCCFKYCLVQISFLYKVFNRLCYSFHMSVCLTASNASCTVKPVLSGHSKNTKNWFRRCRLMQVKCIAECSNGAFCNSLDLHLATICLYVLRFAYF